MVKGPQLFKALSKALVSDQRTVIISKHLANSGYTIGQQVEVQEGSKATQMFIKGAIHIDSTEGLYNLRDALNEAIKAVEDAEEAEKANKSQNNRKKL